MFELSVAYKYLIPRRRQLSVSIISLISTLVIALVVWLVVVFFSVTNGLEKSWVHKLIALTAPVRLTPTEAYYRSYYYQIDAISERAGYALKTIREKQAAPLTDPYDPQSDQEIPPDWTAPDRDAHGALKDLVKLAYAAIDSLKNFSGLQAKEFAWTATQIRLQLLRPGAADHRLLQSSLSYPVFLGNFEGDNPHFAHTLLPVNLDDLNNLFSSLGLAFEPGREERTSPLAVLSPPLFRQRISRFLDWVQIEALKVSAAGWKIPRLLWPSSGAWRVAVVFHQDQVVRVVVPFQEQALAALQKQLQSPGFRVVPGQVLFHPETPLLRLADSENSFPLSQALILAGETPFAAQLDARSIERSAKIEHLLFDVQIPIQGFMLTGKVPYRRLAIAQVAWAPYSAQHPPWWVHPQDSSASASGFVLPDDPEIGEGILLPKSFRTAGVLIGDRGSLSYLAPTASLLQEQLIPVYVAGFYDPGIIPAGGKFVWANPSSAALIRAAHQQDEQMAVSNGINLYFDRIEQAASVKTALMDALQQAGIAPYWKVETYREYEFAQEIMRELQSQKHLFMLIALVVILVACSNIISMLVILVNDKKVEIGILRAMGASSVSIALIFGLAGAWIGLFGSAIGIGAAVITLKNLDLLIALLSHLQGYTMFSPTVYGQTLPNELSLEALGFVVAATVGLSLLAGIIPAIKAALIRPADMLKRQGG